MTLTLTEYLDLVVRHRDWATINELDRERIVREHPDYRQVCEIENSSEAVSSDGSLLPQLNAGLYRLWHKRDWDSSQNKRRAINERIAELQAAWQSKADAVVAGFCNQGINPLLATQMVKGLPQATIEAMWQMQQQQKVG